MKIPKGLKISQVKAGTGQVVEPGKFALIHYDCYLPRGEKCESSRNKEHPVQLKVGERLTFPAYSLLPFSPHCGSPSTWSLLRRDSSGYDPATATYIQPKS